MQPLTVLKYGSLTPPRNVSRRFRKSVSGLNHAYLNGLVLAKRIYCFTLPFCVFSTSASCGKAASFKTAFVQECYCIFDGTFYLSSLSSLPCQLPFPLSSVRKSRQLSGQRSLQPLSVVPMLWSHTFQQSDTSL